MSHFCWRALVFLSSSCKALLTPGRSFLVLDRARSSRYWFTCDFKKFPTKHANFDYKLIQSQSFGVR